MDNFIPSKTIVFIHGLFMNPISWESWIEYFKKRGYKCHAPAYPFHEGNPKELRKNVPAELGKTTFGHVINHLSTFIDSLPEKPVLIGHSMGGLAVQKLIEMNKGVAGVCIDSAPPKGIFSFKWSFLKANLSTINPFKGDSVFIPSVDWFHYAFCNTMSLEQTQVEYMKYVVPESRNIARSSIKSEGKINFKIPHPPLLIIAGENDHIVPSSLNRKNYDAYRNNGNKTDYKEFKGRSHYICNQKNWEEVAQFVYNWIS